MRAEDIVNALKDRLPKLVEDFSDVSAITLATTGTFDGNDTTIIVDTATAHNLTVGDGVTVLGLSLPIAIDTLTRDETTGTAVTVTPHDLTDGSQLTFDIDGATETEFNGTFTILRIPDRYTIEFVMVDSGATVATGSPEALFVDSVLNAISGEQEVATVPTTTQFTYLVAGEITRAVFTESTAEARGNARITASASLDRYRSAYSKQATKDAWLCVVLGDSTANKSRRQDIDATDNIQKAQYFNQKLNQEVILYVFFPTVEDIAARTERDRCEELLQPICQSVLFEKFDSLVNAGRFNPLQITGHGFEEYNTAFYVHRYSFEMVIQLQVTDTSGFEPDVAFRDIDLIQHINLDPEVLGTDPITTDIDLDEEFLVQLITVEPTAPFTADVGDFDPFAETAGELEGPRIFTYAGTVNALVAGNAIAIYTENQGSVPVPLYVNAYLFDPTGDLSQLLQVDLSIDAVRFDIPIAELGEYLLVLTGFTTAAAVDLGGFNVVFEVI